MLYFWMSNIKIAFSVKVLPPKSVACGSKYSAQTISFKHRLCQLPLKTPNHRRPLETNRSAGRPEQSSNQTLVEGARGVSQSGCAHMLIWPITTGCLSNSCLNWALLTPGITLGKSQNLLSSKIPQSMLIKKMPTAFFGTQKEILAPKMNVNK